MLKDSLFNFFSLQIDRLEEQLPFIDDVKNQESIHIVRVCLKKTKTILTFIESFKIPGFSLKKKFKIESKLFEILGKIREGYNQYILLLDKEKILSLQYNEYKRYLKVRLQKESNNLKNINTTQIIDHLRSILKEIFNFLEMYDDNFIYDEAILFINKEFLKITILKNNLKGINDWHKLRKHIKNNVYMMTIVFNSHINSEITSDFINELDILQNNIGVWHDDIVSFEHFAAYIEKNKNFDPVKRMDYLKLLQHLS